MTSEPDDDAPYAIPKKRPRNSGQFKPLVSGNPKGRPKGSRNFMTLLAAELKLPVPIHEGGKSKKISKQHGIIKQHIGKALKGDDKAFGRLIPLMLAIDSKELTEVGQALTDAQKLILARNARRLLDALASKDGCL